MSIYRRLVRGKRSRFFTAEFEYRGKRHVRSGFIDRDSAKHWVSTEMLRLRRGAVGYVKPMYSAPAAPLVAEFVAALRAKGRDEMYCYTAGKRLDKLVAECGWLTLGNVTRESLDVWMGSEVLWRKKAIGARTKNQYADIAVEWGEWLASAKVAKLPSNPLTGTDRLRAKHNDQYRRAATLDELNNLLATCPADRRLCYVFRMYMPMRRKTVRQLTWRMMHLDANPPYCLSPAENNKSRRDEKHVIRFDVAQELRSARKAAKADDAVFPNLPTLADLKADWETAGVSFELAKDKGRLDFHALRRTLVRLAKGAGLSLDQASLLLGHKDPRTTRRYYDEDTVNPELGQMMEKLPTLGQVRKAE